MSGTRTRTHTHVAGHRLPRAPSRQDGQGRRDAAPPCVPRQCRPARLRRQRVRRCRSLAGLALARSARRAARSAPSRFALRHSRSADSRTTHTAAHARISSPPPACARALHRASWQGWRVCTAASAHKKRGAPQWGRTAMHCAAASGHDDAIRVLHRLGADVRRTCLVRPSRGARPAGPQSLRARSARGHGLRCATQSLGTALHVAVMNNHASTTQLLCDMGTPLEVQDSVRCRCRCQLIPQQQQLLQRPPTHGAPFVTLFGLHAERRHSGLPRCAQRLHGDRRPALPSRGEPQRAAPGKLISARAVAATPRAAPRCFFLLVRLLLCDEHGAERADHLRASTFAPFASAHCLPFCLGAHARAAL